jgi:hypothetical protein
MEIVAHLSRVIIWPVILLAYAVLLAAVAHWLTDTWSGAASLGMGAAVIFCVPSMVGYAGYLWRKNMIAGVAKIETIVCVMYPVLLFALWALVTMVGRVRSPLLG